MAMGGAGGLLFPSPQLTPCSLLALHCAVLHCSLLSSPRLAYIHDNKMERIEGQVNEGDTILVDHSDGRTFFVKVESGK